ncbi:MAG: N-6 DNA methylase [Nitrososphaerota archaeon]|nr:N-6 DNA methylase [Nitrososphaerota archaeon]
MQEKVDDFEELLRWYLDAVRFAENEDTKADRFRDFIRRAFPEIDVGFLGGFYPDLEKYVKYIGHGRVVRGRPDSLFGNLIIEFEKTLDDKHLEEAENQLKKYVAGLWSIQAERRQKRGKFTAVATDGLKFVVYKPRTVTLAGPVASEQVMLEDIDQADLRELSTSEAYQWLNRYIVVASSELKTIDPDEFAKEFGVGSKVFDEVMKLLWKGWEKARSKMSTLYTQWDSHLRIVYGSEVASEELYLRHTYLATLAKLVVYASYSGGALPISRDEITNILNGSVFRRWRITNFIEEDFFSWVHRVEEGLEATRTLISKLSSYDLSSVTIDVFKELYQGLVDPEARHDLGEYYTPDWLAEMIVNDVLADNPYKSVLDPACGSGTFLAMAITYKKRMIKDLTPQQLLEHILENVIGIDIHPLAVIIARATYLTTIGRELLEAREKDLIIPVYLSNSIKLLQEEVLVHGGQAYPIDVEGSKRFLLPSSLAYNPFLCDLVIDAVRDYAESIAEGAPDSLELFDLHMSSYGLRDKLSEIDLQTLHYTAQNMAELIKAGKDIVWGFILKNYYKPILFSKKKFDVIVGNPPWLSYRYIKDVMYQKTLKDLIIKEYGLLDSEKVELITQMELATLFFVRSAELYLKEDGTIAFVMPRSVFVADQHHNFRASLLKKPKLSVIRVIDLEDVKPLFNVPSCVIFSRLGEESTYPIKGTIIYGELDRKNEELVKAFLKLNVKHTKFELKNIGERTFLGEEGKEVEIEVGVSRSEYYNVFKNGATIYPKSLWCIEIVKHPKLGIDPAFPYVRTSKRAIERAKSGYEDVKLSGNIESKFLYAVVSGSELVPFGLVGTYLAVLPIEEFGEGYRMITRDEALRKKYNGLAKWLTKAESIWQEKRADKIERGNIYDWLDYRGKLTVQNPKRRFKILYNTSGTYLVSCVVENKPIVLKIDGIKVKVNGTIADWTTYWMETDDEAEAYYLSAILNSPIVDEMIKPMQARGAFGERHIVKKPLELPIPRFDPSNHIHQRLSQIGRECHEKVAKILPALTSKYKSIGKIRAEIKKHLSNELQEIDQLVKQIIKIT